jgi:hypothetical protein
MQLNKLIKLSILVMLLATAYQSFEAQARKADIIPSGFYVLDSALCDLNHDKHPDKILVLENKKVKGVENHQQYGVRFYVLKGNADKCFSLWDKNNSLLIPDDKCAADGYQKLVVKGAYFSIESSICSDWLYVHQVITFKYDVKSKMIVWHRYGESFTDRTNPDRNIPDAVYYVGSLKLVPFNQVTDYAINKLRQQKRKK